jgi:hypothetical protein
MIFGTWDSAATDLFATSSYTIQNHLILSHRITIKNKKNNLEGIWRPGH